MDCECTLHTHDTHLTSLSTNRAIFRDCCAVSLSLHTSNSVVSWFPFSSDRTAARAFDSAHTGRGCQGSQVCATNACDGLSLLQPHAFFLSHMCVSQKIPFLLFFFFLFLPFFRNISSSSSVSLSSICIYAFRSTSQIHR